MSIPHTKERILDAAEEIMWRRSFNSVGLNEILKAVDVPKGSFYHYFKSKEDFGVELLRHYFKKSTDERLNALLSKEIEPDPVARLLGLYKSGVAKFDEYGGKCPCLVLKLAAEVVDQSEPMREVLVEGLSVWFSIHIHVLDEAKEMGLIKPETNTTIEAEFIRDLWAGAVQRATITRSSKPMHQAYAFIVERVASLRTETK
ncbi:TetR/AcrR family transcriptional regulator [Luteolibacter algae]|uniref:TetR/AcrR family transcriptional regulator n=1 Tax=Luteolibacter algae TaxID=454151 RepID=A0ABW5D4V3_9BACT